MSMSRTNLLDENHSQFIELCFVSALSESGAEQSLQAECLEDIRATLKLGKFKHDENIRTLASRFHSLKAEGLLTIENMIHVLDAMVEEPGFESSALQVKSESMINLSSRPSFFIGESARLVSRDDMKLDGRAPRP